MIQKRILWINEAAAEAGVSTVTLHKEISAGRLRTVKVTGKRRYILREDLERWMNGLPPRNEVEIDNFQKIVEKIDNQEFFEFFKNILRFMYFLQYLTADQQPKQESIENE